jgi:hypothetical protein
MRAALVAASAVLRRVVKSAARVVTISTHGYLLVVT